MLQTFETEKAALMRVYAILLAAAQAAEQQQVADVEAVPVVDAEQPVDYFGMGWTSGLPLDRFLD